MITGIDHLGLAIRDRRKAVEFFENVLGAPVYGVATDPTSGLKNGLVRLGEGDFVIQQPPRPGVDPEAEPDYVPPRDPSDLRQVGKRGNLHLDTAVFIRYLERWGEGVHHIGVKTPDLEAAWRTLKDRGVPLFDDLAGGERPGIRGSQLFFPDPRRTFGVLLQFTERSESDGLVWNDAEGGWRDALDGGETPVSPHFDGIDHVGILVDGVDAATDVCEKTIDMTVRERGAENGSDLRRSRVGIGDADLQFREIAHDFGDGHPLARFRPARGKGVHDVVLRCKDLGETRAGLEERGAAIVDNPAREDDRDPAFFLDPATSHAIVFGFVETRT